MKKFTHLSSTVAPLILDNIDTDTLIPASYMRSLSIDPGTGLFGRWRYREDGSDNPDFVLNQPGYQSSKVLLSGANFGCGSSRENAVWALQKFGIECVIALSFSDIFYENCFKTGLLPIVLKAVAHEQLVAWSTAKAEALPVGIDLAQKLIVVPEHGDISFDIAARKQRILMEGIDDITDTLRRSQKIEAFRSRHQKEMPWLYG